jgi:NarL family two-component system response regulator LiaR
MVAVGTALGEVRSQVVEEQASRMHPSARIVIAEEHPLFRTALRGLFGRQAGLEVVGEAADGERALSLCRRLRPELVVMGLSMPKMDGLEATRAIRGEVPATRVLVLTAFDDPDRLAEAVKAGASGYVLKSASPARIVEAVRKVLRGEMPLDQQVSTRLLMRMLKRSPEETHGTPGEEGAGGGEGPTERRPNPLAGGARSLSSREVEVLGLLARGYTNRQIADELFLSTSTVKKHVHKIISKLGVSDRTQAAVLAVELGLLSNFF